MRRPASYQKLHPDFVAAVRAMSVETIYAMRRRRTAMAVKLHGPEICVPASDAARFRELAIAIGYAGEVFAAGGVW